jgi:predicted negative regulator of RcsB-dependent stress response
MDYYVSDDEQLEVIKKWWQANGGAIITGILIGLAVILGWQYWTAYRASRSEQAAAHYDTLLQAVAKQDFAQARQQGQVLQENFAHSTYAALAALELAKVAVEAGDNARAIQQLAIVIDQARQDEIKEIAKLRLARVLLAEKRYDDAEARLNALNNVGFTAEKEELKGDLYLARNDPGKARLAYQAALTNSSGNALVQMKLDNLPAPTASKE